MLETEIKNLTAEIKMLREALTAIPLATPKADEPTPKADEPSVTAADLQEICLTITRADKTMVPSIKALFEEYGGTRIEHIDESKYTDLAESLKALGV